MAQLFRIALAIAAALLLTPLAAMLAEPFFAELLRLVGIDTSQWAAPFLTATGQFFTSPVFLWPTFVVAGMAAGAWIDTLLRRREAGPPQVEASAGPPPRAPIASVAEEPPSGGFEGMQEVTGEDFDLIPFRFLIRATRSDDGIDVSAMIQFRNRSTELLELKSVSSKFTLDGTTNSGRISTGINTPIRPEKTDSIRFLPIRIYSESDPAGTAELNLMFGVNGSKTPYGLSMRYDFTVRSYPENKSVDAVLKADVVPSIRYWERSAKPLTLSNEPKSS